ncbi:hypothetical protein T310_1131 [Rasamsonia emersonii CBS 393.64]|uniref:ferric-chelate reductase (NADPH) n=1 Tax=Rasamsonia emersonii (strain ATCC 16479 / CBS 393.64 / IMI 116815) TaxID=1408163 RepID=A0A0F4Z4R3_RASE3|nr:hypothetical protein T310_1131 [Rasamsonia emersonii CBS 393.64]KKA24863.1 hypothetical protein T310_1131 [Rasamsonia emersonii CBS 393.64]
MDVLSIYAYVCRRVPGASTTPPVHRPLSPLHPQPASPVSFRQAHCSPLFTTTSPSLGPNKPVPRLPPSASWVHSLTEARSRAGSLAMLHLVPTLFSPHLSQAADYMGLPLLAYYHLHGALGLMAFLQSVVHMVAAVRDVSFDLNNQLVQFGFIVYGPFSSLAALLSLNSVLHAVQFIFRNMVAGQPLALADVVKHEGAVELTIQLPRPFKARAGQYVYVRAPGVRPWSFAESHPFTLIWWEDGPDGKAVRISLLAKIESGFTRALSTTPHKQLRVLLDGPYGECKDISEYDSVTLIATGIGIATQLPYAKEFLAPPPANLHGTSNSLDRSQNVSNSTSNSNSNNNDGDNEWEQANIRTRLTHNERVKIVKALAESSGDDFERLFRLLSGRASGDRRTRLREASKARKHGAEEGRCGSRAKMAWNRIER